MSSYIAVALRRLVNDRARGCCEYCLMPEVATFAPHEVDHIIAEKHGGVTEQDNLALSCTLCNQHKGTDIASIDPQTKAVTSLYNPRHDRWDDHFCLSGAELMPLTPVGRVTVRLLQLNRRDRVQERQLLLEAGLLKTPFNPE